MPTETSGDRIRLALRRKGMNQARLAKSLGISEASVSELVRGKWPAPDRMREISAILDVPFEWLTVGDSPPAWASSPNNGMPRSWMTGPGSYVDTRNHDDAQSYFETIEADPATVRKTTPPVGAIPIEGVVSAGPGDIDEWGGGGGALAIPAHWKAVRVLGDSAYPVVYSGQYVLVDEDRSIDINNLDERSGWDLDDDLVLVRLKNNCALLKRFCYHPPKSFVLASVNGGRRSPLIDPSDILHIMPVVSVVYTDPSDSRANRWKEKRDFRIRPAIDGEA